MKCLMSRKTEEEYISPKGKANPKTIAIFTVVMLVLLILMNPQMGIILTLSLIVHELGHAILAKRYNLFKKFILTSDGFAVQRESTDSYTKNMYISSAGFLFSLLPIIILGYFFLDIYDTSIILFGNIIGSTHDFKSIINYRKLHKKGELK